MSKGGEKDWGDPGLRERNPASQKHSAGAQTQTGASVFKGTAKPETSYCLPRTWCGCACPTARPRIPQSSHIAPHNLYMLPRSGISASRELTIQGCQKPFSCFTLPHHSKTLWGQGRSGEKGASLNETDSAVDTGQMKTTAS